MTVMRRHLSTILVVLLLALSPVSYSSETIPDFCPDTPVTENYQIRMVVAGQDATPHRGAATTEVVPRARVRYRVPRSIAPQVLWTGTSSFGRAPPA